MNTPNLYPVSDWHVLLNIQGALGVSRPGNEFITKYHTETRCLGILGFLVPSSCPNRQLSDFLQVSARAVLICPQRSSYSEWSRWNQDRDWRTVRMQLFNKAGRRQKLQRQVLSENWVLRWKEKHILTGRILKQGGNNKLNAHTFLLKTSKHSPICDLTLHWCIKPMLQISKMEKQCLVHFVYINSRIQGDYLPVLLPGKSHRWRSLVGYSSWGGRELDTTERLHCHLPDTCSIFLSSVA